MIIDRATKNPALRKAAVAGQLSDRAVTEAEEARVAELIAEAEAMIGGGQDRDEIVADLARRKLGIETLEARGRDGLDFHDVGVVSLKDALEQAYERGRLSAS